MSPCQWEGKWGPEKSTTLAQGSQLWRGGGRFSIQIGRTVKKLDSHTGANRLRRKDRKWEDDLHVRQAKPGSIRRTISFPRGNIWRKLKTRMQSLGSWKCFWIREGHPKGSLCLLEATRHLQPLDKAPPSRQAQSTEPFNLAEQALLISQNAYQMSISALP